MGIFREGPSPFQTALAMIAAKRDQQVLVIGPGDPQLAAEIALATGLNGRTVLVAPTQASRDNAERRAAEAGAVLELVDAPTEPAAGYDVVVLHGALVARENDLAIVSEAHRLLRPGGRVVAIEGDARATRGLKLFRSRAPARPGAEVRALFDQAGFRATRVLAEVDGAVYVEGVRSGDGASLTSDK